MAVIDVPGDAEAFLKKNFPDEYDFDASALTLTVGAPIYKKPVPKVQQPNQVILHSWTNCSLQPEQHYVDETKTTATSMSLKLEATLKLGRNMSSTIKPIVDLILVSGFSVQLDLTGSGTFSKTGTESLTVKGSWYVAPCTVKTLYMINSAAIYTIDFTIPIDIGGFARAWIPSGTILMSDYRVSVPYRHHYDINGAALVEGAVLDTKTAESRPNCEPGTSCNQIYQGLGDDEFWKRPELKTTPKTAGSSGSDK
jgi:hypothetical protein